MKTLKVVNENGIETKWEVIENSKTGYYNVFAPSGRGKSYKSLKSVTKYLATFNLKLA